MKYIIVAGNPIDGFSFYGVFDSREDAITAGEDDRHLPPYWWVAEVEPL